MTWTAPTRERREAPAAAGERAMLQGWLDFHRDTLLTKCAGLTAEQLARPATPPSTLTLLGLVRHLAYVERCWFRQRFAGEDVDVLYVTEEDPDADLHALDPARAATDHAALGAEIAACDAVAAGRDLEETFTAPSGRTLNLRWVYVHLIEEYARHNGHADLLREAIDGATGA
ncbi:DinB family protein [Streptomyces sp. NPDC056149]|uniref:DinB family protein n=1 Tax=unclassified Streptomyces TaxID=2593676 RepID=UPI0023813FEE|nr:DinB family protein [Streptomyces sp. WZ-12]